VGRDLLERDLRRHRLDLKRLRKNGRLADVAATFGLKGDEALIANVGYGKITSRQVLAKLLPTEALAETESADEGVLRKLFRRVTGDAPGVRVSGVGDVM